MNVKILLSYDGSEFFGWQKTKIGPSIEQALEDALFQLLQKRINLQAASRTDAKVHAIEQVVNFHIEGEICYENLGYRLNRLLPNTIKILDITLERDSFHPTVDSLGKEYEYRISLTPFQNPFDRHYYWHIPMPFDLDKTLDIRGLFIGKKDFACLENQSASPSKNSVCEIFSIDLRQDGDRLYISVHGDRFLYKMVRNLIGVLISVGAGKLHKKQVLQALKSHNRSILGITAPAHGLFLKKVHY